MPAPGFNPARCLTDPHLRPRFHRHLHPVRWEVCHPRFPSGLDRFHCLTIAPLLPRFGRYAVGFVEMQPTKKMPSICALFPSCVV